MEPSPFQPGQEVTLTDGLTGVLYARTWSIRKGSYRPRPATWYFLPDGACAVGLVVVRQPREIDDTAIAAAGGLRKGIWPRPTDWLAPIERQQAYVAHLQGKPLPVLVRPAQVSSASVSA